MKAVIIGAGAHGRVVLDLLKSGTEFNEFEFLDDEQSKWDSLLNGALIAGPIDRLKQYDKNKFKAIIALGNPVARKKVAERLKLEAVPLMNLLPKTAYLAQSARLGAGNTICAGTVINANSEIENHVLINNAAVIEHDSHLCDFVTVCPGALVGGRVEIEEGAFICTGSIVLPRLKIGSYSVLAAGSVLTRDLPSHVLAMGSPARVVKEISDSFEWQRLL